MENSELTAANTAEAAKSSYVSVMMKALASATVFGLIGGFIGHWLGVRGNDQHRQMAEPIMKWGLGGFSAILAAYSSLKASERSAQQVQTADDVATIKSGPTKDAPLMQANDVLHDGKLAENREISRA